MSLTWQKTQVPHTKQQNQAPVNSVMSLFFKWQAFVQSQPGPYRRTMYLPKEGRSGQPAGLREETPY